MNNLTNINYLMNKCKIILDKRIYTICNMCNCIYLKHNHKIHALTNKHSRNINNPVFMNVDYDYEIDKMIEHKFLNRFLNRQKQLLINETETDILHNDDFKLIVYL